MCEVRLVFDQGSRKVKWIKGKRGGSSRVIYRSLKFALSLSQGSAEPEPCSTALANPRHAPLTLGAFIDRIKPTCASSAPAALVVPEMPPVGSTGPDSRFEVHIHTPSRKK
ncbi:hypothetical protein LIA77_07563 [Sarocladium implicatum]|nr:hypothetical protein LIA77_07563 [Sarocladium implicatum]